MQPRPGFWWCRTGVPAVMGLVLFLPPGVADDAPAGGKKEATKVVTKDVAEAAGGKADDPKPAAKKAESKPLERKIAVKVDAPPRLAVAPAGNADDLTPFEKQCEGPVRKVCRTELHFLRVVCRPTKDQYDAIVKRTAQAATAAVKKAARRLQQAQLGQMAGANDPGLREQLTQELTGFARAVLTPEQFGDYQAELGKRAAARKRLAVSIQLVNIDKQLLLSEDQRGRLEKVLEASWKENWDRLIGFYSVQFYPPLPDQKVLPLLTARQKQIWNELPKSDPYPYLDFDDTQGLVEIEDDVWAEPAPARDGQPAPAAERAPEKPDAPKAKPAATQGGKP